MKRKALSLLHQVWQTIGGDILQVQIECGEEPALSGAHVGEICMDHLDQGGDPEAIAWLRDLSYEEQDKVLHEAFPLHSYGY